VVFRLKESRDYKGIDDYAHVWALTGSEEFSGETMNGMIECVQDYLSFDRDHVDLFNSVKRERAFPRCLVMSTPNVHRQNGLLEQAVGVSSGAFSNLTYPTGLPICVCVTAEGYNVFVAGVDVYEKSGARENLQSLIPQYLKRYSYRKPLIVFAYNMMKRGVTSQFTDESNEQEELAFEDDPGEASGRSWRVLGFVRNIVGKCRISGNNRKRKGPGASLSGCHTRSNETITQQMMRAAMRKGTFDIPYLDRFKVRAALTEELLENMRHHKRTEADLLDLLHQTSGDLDAAWRALGGDADSPRVVQKRFSTVGAGKGKTKVDALFSQIEGFHFECEKREAPFGELERPGHFRAGVYALWTYGHQEGKLLSIPEIVTALQADGLCVEDPTGSVAAVGNQFVLVGRLNRSTRHDRMRKALTEKALTKGGKATPRQGIIKVDSNLSGDHYDMYGLTPELASKCEAFFG
jgi:hypothetical protein